MGTPDTRAYLDGALCDEGFPVADVSEHLEKPGVVIWVDLCRPSADELHELADELGLHELAVEDALEPHQRPKLDYYGTHLFLSCHDVRLDKDAMTIDKTEIDAFIGNGWLITVRSDDQFSMKVVQDRCERSADLARSGVAYFIYGLLDVIVDSYFTILNEFDDFFDMVSEGIFADEPINPSDQRRWFEMRRSLVQFHRLVGPIREAVSSLMRRQQDVIPDELAPYFQDIYDHTLRVAESTDALRDLVTTIVETNLSLRDYRQNQVMKKVTSWAAIIAVPTLITGYYGMNLPYPGFETHWGVVLSIVLMVGVSLGLYISFKRRGWL
jgi:magnesium transporter